MLIRQIRLKVTLRSTVTELNPYFFCSAFSGFPIFVCFWPKPKFGYRFIFTFFLLLLLFCLFFSILVPFLFALVKTNMTLPPFFFVFFVFALLLVVF